jgi:hypothetical protein
MTIDRLIGGQRISNALPFVGASKVPILANFSGAAINLGDRRYTAAALWTSPQRARI